jgi:hypothetical protein
MAADSRGFLRRSGSFGILTSFPGASRNQVALLGLGLMR